MTRSLDQRSWSSVIKVERRLVMKSIRTNVCFLFQQQEDQRGLRDLPEISRGEGGGGGGNGGES